MCAMLILHGKIFTRMRVLLVFLYVLCASYGQTQPTGTFGRDFYIGILKTFIDNSIPEFSILITSNTSGTATIYIPHLGINTTRSFNQSLDYEVTGDTITKINATVERKGIHVTTDVDVTLVVLKHPRNTVEGFLSLPATMLSTEYVIASYDSHNDKRYLSNFLIVSAHDNTDIEIHENNSIYSVSMNHLDTYLFRGYNDLSGVVVRSNKPIAVFSGHESAQVPKPCFDGEYLVEQLLPVKHFAYEFIVPPIPLRSGYVVRVYSSVQNTTFTYSNATNSKTISLAKAGDFLEILSDNNPMYVLADKPVQVMMYATCLPHNNTARGDIFMTIVPSVTQFTNSYHFTVKALYGFTHYLAITTRTEFISGLRINDHAMGNLFHTYNVSHAYLTFNVNVYKMTGGVYHLQHEQGKTFGAIQCGFGSNFAYGYPLGINNSKDGGLTCLDCKDMSHLYLCDTVTTCSNGQVCYVETFKTNGGQVKYNSGCVDSHQCAGWKQQKSKRSAECVHCCSSQLCNANGCGSQGLPSQDLRGPLCYDCSYVSNMEECKTVKLCAQDEVCSIEKYDWGGVYDHYTAKCHSMQCISHKRSFNQYVSSARTARSTPVCQNCCSSDLCNTKCNMTSQGGPGVAIVG